MKLPSFTFTALWTAMVFLHGHFFLILAPRHLPIFITIDISDTLANSALIPTNPPSSAPPPAEPTLIASNYIFTALRVFAVNYTFAVLSALYKAFTSGGQLEIWRYMREACRVPLRSLVKAYVLECLGREVVGICVALGLTGLEGRREAVKAVLRVFVGG